MLQRAPEPHCDAADQRKSDDPVHCSICFHLVTRSRWAISIDGHEHVFANPRGLVFRVVCYDEAPGAVAEGEATDQFTWFKGFLWQFVLFRGCGEHLGWKYRRASGDSSFYGLIKGNLTDQAE